MDPQQIQSALNKLDIGKIIAVTELQGGTSQSYALDLHDGSKLVLKTYSDINQVLPRKEARAAAYLKNFDLPVTQYVMLDETKSKLPFHFAITNYLPGVTAGSLIDHPDINSIYHQMGMLLRKLHAVQLPAYGAIGANGVVAPVETNAGAVRIQINYAFEKFLKFGADPMLAKRLRTLIDQQFDAIITHSTGPVFAHDDLHPNNVLVTQNDDHTLTLSGLIYFGNAQAADSISDLAKCLFCAGHEAPGCQQHILAGYGKINHPDPEEALNYYTLLHRVMMWWWLRHIGVIASADAPSELIDDLQAMANG